MAGPRRMKRRGRRGYTLIELMVALVVLTLGLFSIIHLQVVSIRGNSFAEEINQATLIALGAMEQISTQGLQWVDRQGNLYDNPLASAMPGFEVDTAPETGTLIQFPFLKSLRSYNGCDIAMGPDRAQAKRINYLGITGDTVGLEGESAIYRVHYVAVPVTFTEGASNTIPPEAVNSLIKVELFVSWLNRSHGPKENYDWSNWDDSGTFTSDADSFCNRHMVVATFYLPQNVM